MTKQLISAMNLTESFLSWLPISQKCPMFARKYQYTMSFQLPKYTWDKDRKLCEKCKHYAPAETGGAKERKSLSMTCSASKRKSVFGPTTCIDERTTGACGPKGKLFTKK